MSPLGGIFAGDCAVLGDARAMTAEAIQNWNLQNLVRAQQAVFPDQYNQLLANYRPYPERPLDERFADFKIRLAAAIARRAA